jgi:N-acetylmuramoyl-L-alanine amidase
MFVVLDRSSNDYQVLLKTIYGEARGESTEGQKAVAWVIKNRANRNLSHWGGYNIANVCKQRLQFSCWNGVSDILMSEANARAKIELWLPAVYTGKDNTNGATHYYANRLISPPSWTRTCIATVQIGNHAFYRCQR